METNKDTIKIFQTAKKQLELSEIYAYKPIFCKQQIFEVVQSIVTISSQCVYLFCVASTTREYMNSIYMTMVGILVFICYLSAIFKKEITFFFIDDLEATINES